jgi:hypothetical protein
LQNQQQEQRASGICPPVQQNKMNENEQNDANLGCKPALVKDTLCEQCATLGYFDLVHWGREAGCPTTPRVLILDLMYFPFPPG